MQRKAWIAGAVSFLMLIGIVIGCSVNNAVSGEDPVAEVNGSPIRAEELERTMERQRASVIDYFARTHGAVYDSSFWQSSFNGENPLELARQRALDEQIAIRIELELARRYGLVEDEFSGDLMLLLDEENKKRMAAKAKGEAVYGPLQLTESDFIPYFMSRLRIELKERLAADAIPASEAIMMAHYEEIKNELFRLEDTVAFYLITAPYGVDQRDDMQRKSKAEQALESVKSQLEQGMELGDAITEVDFEMQWSKEVFNSETARIYFKSLPAIYETLAGGRGASAASPIVDDRGAGAFAFAWIVDRESGGYSGFQEQRGNVFNHYMNGAYDEYVSRLTAEADVQVDEERYNRIAIR